MMTLIYRNPQLARLFVTGILNSKQKGVQPLLAVDKLYRSTPIFLRVSACNPLRFLEPTWKAESIKLLTLL